jgi:hypothetical protein
MFLYVMMYRNTLSFTWDSYSSMLLPLVMQGCLEKSFAMEFQMLLCGECYENIYT